MKRNQYITGTIETRAGNIPVVTGQWKPIDKMGNVKVRLGINRDKYQVLPGLYAIGKPTEKSDVFVSANYKLSFDHLRRSIYDLNAWILVLDTKGVNVWCAAGKGTFATKELVNRIHITRLDEVVTHRRLIVPQLGAVGISAHEVTRLTKQTENRNIPEVMFRPVTGNTSFSSADIKPDQGFRVIYGPVRARDIKAFIQNKYVASPEMRRVTFLFSERALLIPVDLLYGKYLFLVTAAILMILSGVSNEGLSLSTMVHKIPGVFANVLFAYLAGIVLMPLALPFIPGRSFALKGGFTGALVYALAFAAGNTGSNAYEGFSWFLIMVAISSFLAMNFTGSSTYTSLSGVKKEMKVAVPLQIAFSFIGLVLFIVSKMI
jgi:acetyl-CoA decarbonylase/synthase complex subunit gamma